MADNYLEKKYEEYKSRKEGRTNHPYNGRKTTVIHKTRRVFVTVSYTHLRAHET